MKIIAKPSIWLFVLFIISGCSLSRNIVAVSISQDQPVKIQTFNGSNHLPGDYPVEAIKFSHLTSKDGISQSVITCIYQDDFGYIWFGTEDGLNKFDGKNVIVYRNDPDDPNSISSNDISSITQSSDGVIWVGTHGGGLNKYNRETGIFTHYLHQKAESNTLSSDYIKTLLFDTDGYLWIGTLGGGLNRLDLLTGKILQYLQDSNKPGSISSNDVLSLAKGGKDTLWIGTVYGLDKLQISSQVFSNFRSNPVPVVVTRSAIPSLFYGSEGLLIGTEAGLFYKEPDAERIREIPINPENSTSKRIPIQSILHGGDGYFWIGTYNYGMYRISTDFSIIQPITSDPRNSSSLSDNRILSLLEDKSGIIWVGTYSGFVNYINPLKNRFKSLEFSPWLENSISNAMIWAVQPEGDSRLWIGTDGGGLNYYDLSSGQNQIYKHDPGVDKSIDNNHIHSFLIDKSGQLWVGTDAGLNLFVKEENIFKHIRLWQTDQIDEFDRRFLPTPKQIQVLTIKQDETGSIWIGTGGAGLFKLDPVTELVEHFEYQPGYSSVIPSNLVWLLYPDKNNIIWIGTNHGLVKYNHKNRSSTTYLPSVNKRESISDYRSLSMLRDSRGILWIGTASGLNKFDESTNSFTVFRVKDGLPNDFIYSIQEDIDGMLWLSTNRGISKFNPNDNSFINYSIGAGLAGEEYNQGAGATSKDGQMYFGGVFGITYFHPNEIYKNQYQPDIYLSSLTQGGQQIIPKLPLEIVKSIQLTWPKNFIEFTFQDQHAFVSENKQYAYRLSPFENNWTITDTYGQGRYTNLPGGEYELWLRSSDEEGGWYPEKKALTVTIIPPAWENRNFISIFGVSIIAVIAGIIYLRMQSTQRRTKELAQLVKLRTREIDQRRQVAEGLREILIRINSDMTLEDSLSFIADQICQIMKVENVVIAQCERRKDKNNTLIISSSKDTEIDNALINLLYQNLRQIDNPSRSTGDIIQTIQPFKKNDQSISKSITSLPVYLDGKIEAILILFTRNVSDWNIEERELFTSFAEQIALAIGNAHLRRNTAELAMLNERNRLARDLHDAVTQTLFSASLLAEAFPGVWEKNPVEGKKLIQEMRQLTRGALAEMRSLLMELRPASMAEAKLSDLIRQLVEAVSGRTGLKIEFSVPSDLQLPSDVNITFYRIAQEALTNIVKHAKASNVRIVCSKNEVSDINTHTTEETIMVIEDDGCGFEEKTIAQDHFGLYNMRERADSIDADIEISSKLGVGTKIEVYWKGKGSTGDDQ